jgi:CubicO group peptidase (beta-lactamase class C family)
MAAEAGGLRAERLAQIAPMLQAEVDRDRLAGAVTLVWRKGELAHLATVGRRDIAEDAPMASDTLFRIASMTKPIVSLAALMLAEEGRLGLQDPITLWLPELAGRQVLADPAGPLHDTTPAPREITVEDLLTHRSGLAAGFSSVGPIAEAYAERLGSPRGAPLSPQAWLRALAGLPLSCAPGARFLYGCSTDVLGLLIARLEGAPLGEVLRRRILAPLGMTSTFFWPSAEERRRLARLYRIPPEPGPLQDASFPLANSPPAFESGGGGLFSTALDYLTFARLLLGQGEVDGVRLAQPQTVALMTANRLTPAQRALPFLGLPDWWRGQGFGLGLSMFLGSDPAGRGAGSPGSFGWPGAFGTWWMADPAEDMVLIYLIQDSVPPGPQAVSRFVSAEAPGGRAARAAFQTMVYGALER